MRRTARFCLTLALLAGAGCGGGGGGGGGGPGGPVFEGTYHYVTLGGTDPSGPEDHVLSKFGTATPGGGALGLTYRRNSNGDPMPPVTESDVLYEVSPDGSFRWIIPFFSSAPFAEGGLGRGGEFGILANTFETSDPEIRLVLRRGGNPDESSLVGPYFYLAWIYDPDRREHRSYTGGYTFDGAGDWDGLSSVNVDGGAATRTALGWYTLNAGGDLVVNDGSYTITGGLSADRTLAILGGSSNPGAVCLAVLLRQHTVGGLTDATFSGRYSVVTLLHLGGAYLSTVGTFDADGAGNWTMTVEGNVDGDWLAPNTRTGTYQVDSRGRLNIDTSAGRICNGGVAANGSVACVAPSLGAPAEPQIWVLVRR